jgi:glutaminase
LQLGIKKEIGDSNFKTLKVNAAIAWILRRWGTLNGDSSLS